MKEKIKIGVKVVVLDDVDDLAGKEGVVVGVGEGGCVYGEMYEVEFENGDVEWMMRCDLRLKG